MSSELYTFLLVDDEEIIRDGISKKINWEEEGFRLLTPCTDGTEAIECIARQNPDVVLTDICMPRKDGLEVASYIKDNNPDTITLILSGYDDFEYAQKAVGFNVMDYILKPISAKTLKKHLKQIRDALKKRDQGKKHRIHMLELLEKSKEAVRDRLLTRLLSGRILKNDFENVKEDLLFLGTSEYFGVVCLELDILFDAPAGKTSAQDLNFLGLEEICSEVLKDEFDFARISTAENRLVIILGRHSPDALILELKAIAGKIIGKVNLPGNSSASAGLGLAVKDITGIHTSYRQAVAALQNRLIAGNNGIFVFDKNQCSDLNKRIELSRCSEDIRREIRVGRKEDILSSCDTFFSIIEYGGLPSRQARMEIVKFISVILDVLEEIGIAETKSGEITLADQLYEIMSISRISSLKQSLIRFFDQVSSIMQDRRSSFPQKKIDEITRFLDVHFADSFVSAESVAERFYISTSYLTRLFKQNHEMGFLEYLNKLKMEKAKELMKTTEMKNYEIAEAIGFRDPHYFSSSFKKYQGQTPSEYKQGL